MMMPKSLESVAQRRVQITDRIAAPGDPRCGSITSTTGRCGKPICHCHQPNQPVHGPNLRLTYKAQGKTVTQSLPNLAAVRKAECLASTILPGQRQLFFPIGDNYFQRSLPL